MIDIDVQITGPGLVVNGASFVIIDALKEAGFNVACKDWRGMDRHVKDERLGDGFSVTIKVNPMPWGG